MIIIIKENVDYSILIINDQTFDHNNNAQLKYELKYKRYIYIYSIE